MKIQSRLCDYFEINVEQIGLEIGAMIEHLLDMNACAEYDAFKTFLRNRVLTEIEADYCIGFKINSQIEASFLFACSLSDKVEPAPEEYHIFQAFVEGHVLRGAHAGMKQQEFTLYNEALPSMFGNTLDIAKNNTASRSGASLLSQKSLFPTYYRTGQLVCLLDHPINSNCILLGRYSKKTFGPRQQEYIVALQSSLLYRIYIIAKNQNQQKIQQAAVSSRELQVLTMLGAALTNREIAERLNLSQNTIRFHIKNLHRKLGTSRRTELALFA